MAVSYLLEVTAHKDVLDGLASAMGTNADLSFINDLAIEMSAAMDGKWQQMDLGVLFSGDRLFTMDMILNDDGTEFYLGIPELSKVYLDYSEMLQMANANRLSSQETKELLQEILPEEKVLNAMLKKYVKLVFDNVTEVSSEEETVKVDGVEQKVTVLKYELTIDSVADICNALLKEAKTDEDIKEILNNFAEGCEKRELINEEVAAEFYDSYLEAIDNALESVDALREAYPDWKLVVYDYVDGMHQIVGRAAELNGEDLFRYLTVKNGNESALEIVVENQFRFVGSGKTEKDRFNGSYSVIYNDMKFVVVNVKDFDMKGIKDGYVDGKIVIVPSDGLINMIGETATPLSQLVNKDLSLEIAFDGEKAKQAVAVNLKVKDETMLGIKMTMKAEKASQISRPDDTIVIETQDDIQQWAATFDYEGLQQKLEESGLLEIIQDLTTPDDSYNDDYDWDDNYGWDEL
jgi:hypothetical protein